MSTSAFLKNSLLVCTLALGFVACQKSARDFSKSDSMVTEKSAKGGTAAMKGTSFYALTSSNELVHYLSGNPLMEESSMPITGLAPGEKILAIDFRPATGILYGVSSASKIYTINLNSGMAMAVAGSFSPVIDGEQVGFDFNPTVDRIRLVTNKGQNLRLHPVTGMVVGVDGMINPANTDVTAVAYTNSFAGATSTVLYDIDILTDMLYIQAPPNNGTLSPVGLLGIQAIGEAGFDIAPDNSVAIAALFGRGLEEDQVDESEGNKYRFYYINLATGEAKNAGKTERMITGIAIAPNQQ